MCFVANIIHRFPAVQKFENQLRFDKVTESSKVGTFFETQYWLDDVITVRHSTS